jgi:hypothetical protein
MVLVPPGAGVSDRKFRSILSCAGNSLRKQHPDPFREVEQFPCGEIGRAVKIAAKERAMFMKLLGEGEIVRARGSIIPLCEANWL